MRQQETQPVGTRTTSVNTTGEQKRNIKTGNIQEDGEEHAGKWSIFVIVAIGVFMATLD
jgi:hypothetical protein